jgi:hypothetical protein
VDERATEMTDEAEKPENEQNNKDSPEHRFLWVEFPLLRARSCECAYGFILNGKILNALPRVAGDEVEQISGGQD